MTTHAEIAHIPAGNLRSETTMSNDTMTFGETFRAIRDGDIDIIIAFSIECLIMASPVIILYGAWVYS